MPLQRIKSKIVDRKTASSLVDLWKDEKHSIVFTNGCFDLLHYGHLNYLAEAKELGDKLVIGLNSKESVKRLKGNHRPINDDLTRSYLLASLEFVDLVVFFEEDTPYHLINILKPQILVKGGDYQPEEIVGYDLVKENGGEVKVLSFVKGYSTTNIEKKIKENCKNRIIE